MRGNTARSTYIVKEVVVIQFQDFNFESRTFEDNIQVRVDGCEIGTNFEIFQAQQSIPVKALIAFIGQKTPH